MMTPSCGCLTGFGPSELCSVTAANGAKLPVTGKGTKAFQGVHGTILIPEVHCVPDLAQPLFSVPQIYDHGGKVAFHRQSVDVHTSPSHTPSLTGYRKGKTWYIPDPAPGTSQAFAVGSGKPRPIAAPVGVQPIAAPLGVQHIAAPVGVQPLAAPVGVQHIAAPVGVQHIAAPVGVQPIAAPLGVQPIAAPLGVQPIVRSILCKDGPKLKRDQRVQWTFGPLEPRKDGYKYCTGFRVPSPYTKKRDAQSGRFTWCEGGTGGEPIPPIAAPVGVQPIAAPLGVQPIAIDSEESQPFAFMVTPIEGFQTMLPAAPSGVQPIIAAPAGVQPSIAAPLGVQLPAAPIGVQPSIAAPLGV
jgi:hypothetical protein